MQDEGKGDASLAGDGDQRQAALEVERTRRGLTKKRRRRRRWLRYSVIARSLCGSSAALATLGFASMLFWYEGHGRGYIGAGVVVLAAVIGTVLAHRRVVEHNSELDSLEDDLLKLEDPTSDLRLRTLDEERDDLERRILDQTLLRNFLNGLVLLDVSAVVALPFWYEGKGYWGLLAASLILLAFLQVTRDRARELEADRRQTEYEAAVMRSPRDQKPETLFLKHQFEVRRYYDQTLRHGALVFYLGIVVLAVGVLVVGGAYYVIVREDETSLNIVVAALAAVGTLFTNVIAYQYLRMHAAAVEAVGTFHDRLVEDHDLHFANLLAYETEDEDARNRTVVDLALRVVARRRKRQGSGPGDTQAD